jgi:lysozyme
MTRSINAEGLALIKEFEGLKLTAYQDIGGVWTIGYGSTGPGIKEGMTIPEDWAETYLKNDCDNIAREIEAMLTDDNLTDNAFSALISFCYNLGVGAFHGSTMLKLINQNKITEAADQFSLWIHVDGKEVPGLLRRRLAEQKLFLKDA